MSPLKRRLHSRENAFSLVRNLKSLRLLRHQLQRRSQRHRTQSIRLTLREQGDLNSQFPSVLSRLEQQLVIWVRLVSRGQQAGLKPTQDFSNRFIERLSECINLANLFFHRLSLRTCNRRRQSFSRHLVSQSLTHTLSFQQTHHQRFVATYWSSWPRQLMVVIGIDGQEVWRHHSQNVSSNSNNKRHARDQRHTTVVTCPRIHNQ